MWLTRRNNWNNRTNTKSAWKQLSKLQKKWQFFGEISAQGNFTHIENQNKLLQLVSIYKTSTHPRHLPDTLRHHPDTERHPQTPSNPHTPFKCAPFVFVLFLLLVRPKLVNPTKVHPKSLTILFRTYIQYLYTIRDMLRLEISEIFEPHVFDFWHPVFLVQSSLTAGQ